MSVRAMWVRSVKKYAYPNWSLITCDHAPEADECPLVYSGNGGVVKSGDQSESMFSRIYVIGLTKLKSYLHFQQLTNASDTAIVLRAKTSAHRASDAPESPKIWEVMAKR